MKSTVTFPQEDVEQSISEFRFKPGSKDVVVILLNQGERQRVDINIQEMLDSISAANKNVIRQWYKNMAQLAIDTLNDRSGVVITPISGEAFDDV